MDDRSGPRAVSLRRHLGGRRPGPITWPPGPLRASCLILRSALATATESPTRPPLAFTIQDLANRHTAGSAAVASRIADRRKRSFVAPRPGAQREAKKIFAA